MNPEEQENQEQEEQELQPVDNSAAELAELKDLVKQLLGSQKEPESKEELKTMLKEALSVKSQSAFPIQELINAIKGEDKGLRHQSHGLTQNDIKKIHKAQQLKNVEMMPANLNSKYQIPVVEKGFIHFSTERVFYNDAGIKQSKPRQHIFEVAEYEKMSKSVKSEGDVLNPDNAFSGLKVIVYHDPRKSDAEIKAMKDSKKKLSREDALQHMSDEGVRQVYLDTFYEEALPGESKPIVIQQILDQWEKESKN